MQLENLSINLNVNGDPYDIVIKPYWTLLQVLRDQLRLTGTKKGCGAGECGSCIVLIDGKPVNSCITLAAKAEGKNIFCSKKQVLTFSLSLNDKFSSFSYFKKWDFKYLKLELAFED